MLTNQKFILLLIAIFLSSCVTKQAFEDKLMAYKGRDVNELIQKFGVPDKEFKAPNGDLMYTWTQTSTSHVPAYTPPSVTTYNRNGNLVAATTTPGLTTGGYSYSTSCRVDATADKRTHVITALRYVGPGCVARPD